jgi:hypothetical protein
LKPAAALAIFERLVGRPATAEKIAEVERDETTERQETQQLRQPSYP